MKSATRPTRREWGRLRLFVLDRDGWRCQDCGKAGRLECDHVRPLHLGGDNSPENLQALCIACHLVKTRAEAGGDPLPGVEAWDDLIERWSNPEG